MQHSQDGKIIRMERGDTMPELLAYLFPRYTIEFIHDCPSLPNHTQYREHMVRIDDAVCCFREPATGTNLNTRKLKMRILKSEYGRKRIKMYFWQLELMYLMQDFEDVGFEFIKDKIRVSIYKHSEKQTYCFSYDGRSISSFHPLIEHDEDGRITKALDDTFWEITMKFVDKTEQLLRYRLSLLKEQVNNGV
jgi:hypothetical protein